jgi:hypothetical protein
MGCMAQHTLQSYHYLSTTMVWETLHNKVLGSYVKYLTLRDSMTPPSTLNIGYACMQLQNNNKMLRKIQDTCYLNP